MTHAVEGKRRPAAAMAGYALALAGKHAAQDKRDAAAMRSYLGMHASVKLAARMAILAGLAGGRS